MARSSWPVSGSTRFAFARLAAGRLLPLTLIASFRRLWRSMRGDAIKRERI